MVQKFMKIDLNNLFKIFYLKMKIQNKVKKFKQDKVQKFKQDKIKNKLDLIIE